MRLMELEEKEEKMMEEEGEDYELEGEEEGEDEEVSCWNCWYRNCYVFALFSSHCGLCDCDSYYIVIISITSIVYMLLLG